MNRIQSSKKISKWNLHIMGALAKSIVFVARKEPSAAADVARRATTKGVNDFMIDCTWEDRLLCVISSEVIRYL